MIMEKILFLKQKELVALGTKHCREAGAAFDVCYLDVDEKDGAETLVYDLGNGKDVKRPLVDIIPYLNKTFSVEVNHYDVLELGDLGDGFAFFLKFAGN